MYCPQCGTQNPDAVTVCSECGTDMQALVRQYEDSERPPRPKNHLVLSIVSLILGFLPLGIVALVSAIQVNKQYDAGDYKNAEKYSRWANNFAWVALLLHFLWLATKIMPKQ